MTRTTAEAIADIRAALCARMRTAESAYDHAQRHFPVGSVQRREAFAVLSESRAAYRAAKGIAETVTDS